MVDLKELSLEDLTRMVNLYPWFGAARKELACRTEQYAGAALYVLDRSILAEAARLNPSPDGSSGLKELLDNNPDKFLEQKVVVLGGDYFSQDAYDSIHAEDTGRLRTGTDAEQKDAIERTAEAGTPADDFLTETLADIYAHQGYLEQAKDIYSKLILRYPEKSAYFATLIENLNNINNQ